MNNKDSSFKGNNFKAAVFLTVLIIGVFVFLKRDFFLNDSIKDIANKNQKEVVLVLDFDSKGKTRKFHTFLAENGEIRAWSLLQQASASANIELAIKDYFVPVSIGGVSNGDIGKNWRLYVNNEKKEFEPFNVLIKGGDEVVFKFE